MYCVHWNTRKARLARKSRADSRPATGRSWKPDRSARAGQGSGARRGGGGEPRGWRARPAHVSRPPRPAPPAQRPHPSGSGTRPPAAGCCPPRSRRSAPAARTPPGAPGRRAWRTGPSACRTPPSCGAGALRPGRGPRPPRSPAGLSLRSGGLRVPGWGAGPRLPGGPTLWPPLPRGQQAGPREAPPPLAFSFLLEATACPQGDSEVVPWALLVPGPAPSRPLSWGLTRWRSPPPCTPHEE